jgi:mannitol-specific phosphotransferase system IIBC component
MKKLLTVLFTAMIAFSLAMPVFAQETTTTTTAAKTKKTKATKTKKTKKEKTTTTTAQ